MTEIMTVNGPITPDQLGITDYHEHLYVEPPAWLHSKDPDFALDSVEKSSEELQSFAKAGGRTLCELTAVDFGRNVAKIKAIADKVPEVNVIMTAGYNRPHYMGRWGHAVAEADMIRDTVRDLTVGIDGTDIKAGIIKCGTEYNNFNEMGQKLVRVAAAAYRETGRPVITHTTAGTMGYEQSDLLIELGVDAHRIALSHMDRNPDSPDHKRIAAMGVYIGYDSFGKSKYGPESRRIALLRDMIDSGHGQRLLIGNDLGRPSYWRAYGGGPGLDFVLTSFRARLLQEGFTEAELTMLFIDNPRRFFAGER
jgi:predicted metal-dependent phosphotriesterase family hydrolase